MVKVLTYILILTVLSFSVKPGIDTVLNSSNIQQTCCSNNKCSPVSDKQDSDNQDDQEDKQMCNPFQACCAYFFAFVTLSFDPIIQVYTLSQEFFGYQSFIASQFISSFWQPPQFV